MFLALFPLQLALFPGEEIPLHIFEPRYKQLIAECRDHGILFGIPALAGGNVSKVGTEVELVRILETSDTGEMDIVVRGIRVFRIDNLQTEVPHKLYSGAEVTLLENDARTDPDAKQKLLERYEEFMRLIRKGASIPNDLQDNASFVLGSRVGLSLNQRLSMLRTPKEADRQKYLLHYLERAIQAIRQRRSTGMKVGRGNGTTRHIGD
ncbi:MAG: LON peptidase substrate-binding domain-containing protein [Candidatus Hydrogenedentes bacterium]|nr:LON peptidase substrate-binding domain-containing protein [Candidatus Hydrogenedentota bacterium]